VNRGNAIDVTSLGKRLEPFYIGVINEDIERKDAKGNIGKFISGQCVVCKQEGLGVKILTKEKVNWTLESTLLTRQKDGTLPVWFLKDKIKKLAFTQQDTNTVFVTHTDADLMQVSIFLERCNTAYDDKIDSFFHIMDIDHSGFVEMREVETLFKRLRVNMTSEFREKFQAHASKTGNNGISKVAFKEFYSEVVYEHLKKDNARFAAPEEEIYLLREQGKELFNTLAMHNPDSIQMVDLTLVLLAAGKDENSAQAVLQDLDRDQSGGISEEEFLDWFCGERLALRYDTSLTSCLASSMSTAPKTKPGLQEPLLC